jgi:predicted secreted hydrolase
MSPLNALPWNTIIVIISISIFIPSFLTVLFIKFRRFEDLGMVLGVFLLVLSLFSYFYLIPNQIIDETMLPENYIWEDTGQVKYWERNSVFLKNNDNQMSFVALSNLMPRRSPIFINFTGKEVIHAVSYDKEKNQMYINDVIFDENNEIFTVINGNEKVSEWYFINPKLSSLKFVNVDGGYMGIPSNNQNILNAFIGWVESQGVKDGNENVVLVRDMHKIKTGVIDGVEVSVWQSDIYNLPITWHEESYVCDETLQLIVHQKTGYIVHVYRHLMLYAHLSQFVELYFPDALKNRIVSKYLSINDPIGEAAELTYATTDESQAQHVAAVKEIDAYMTYIPVAICLPMFLFGLAFTWRYWGRSYYWKRYKDFEQESSVQGTRRKKTPKKIIAFGIVFIIVFSSIGYIFFTNFGKQNEIISKIEQSKEELIIEPEPPTPPGSLRAIDSGRHVLQPADEGAHRFSGREWWYFNVFFNDPISDLQGSSMIISFNRMALADIRFLRRDNHFIVFYDNDTKTSYDFSLVSKRRGTLKASGPGVDVNFKNSYVTGTYPTWNVHVESEEGDFIADLAYTSVFMPVWVMGRSSNLAIFRHFGGDYYAPRCYVEGNITWNNNVYFVCGTGYMDHVWQTSAPRFISKGWDWLNLHFDNGWEMYLSKFIFRMIGNTGYAGALILSPNNQNIVEYNIFSVKYVENARLKGLPSLTYPTKFLVEAKKDDMVLNLEVELINPCEIIFKLARTGMIEGPVDATGTFSWSNYTVELNGYGMYEATRVKYLLQLPGIIPRIFQRLILRNR